jgi:hypothetical protein
MAALLHTASVSLGGDRERLQLPACAALHGSLDSMGSLASTCTRCALSGLHVPFGVSTLLLVAVHLHRAKSDCNVSEGFTSTLAPPEYRKNMKGIMLFIIVNTRHVKMFTWKPVC